jgi:hypothetical protein
VPDPIETAKIGDQALSLLARYRAALGLANQRIGKVKACNEQQRARLAAGR